jgi:hypothetical protein
VTTFLWACTVAGAFVIVCLTWLVVRGPGPTEPCGCPGCLRRREQV